MHGREYGAAPVDGRRMENAMGGITEGDALYQETKQKAGEYSNKLDALGLPDGTKLLIFPMPDLLPDPVPVLFDVAAKFLNRHFVYSSCCFLVAFHELEKHIGMLLRLSAFFDVTVDYLLGNGETAMSSFTKYEMDLVMAARKADDRAREDALNTLRSHRVQKKKMRHA